MKKGIIACIILFLLFVTTTEAATFTVTNNSGGTGVGSLRWALNQAEASAGADIITFSGDFTISPVGGARILYFDDSGLILNPDGFNITIDGTNLTGDPTWPIAGMWIYDSRYDGAWGRLAKDVLVKGITIQNCADAAFLINRGASDITLQDCIVIGNNPLIIDGTLPSSDGLQVLTDITLNNCIVNGGNIIVTQSSNYQSLMTILWASTTAGIWGDEQKADIESFLISAGNNLGSLILSTNAITSGTQLTNNGTIKTAILKGSQNYITNNGTAGMIVGGYNEVPFSSAGANTIINRGNAALVVGSYNQAQNTSSVGNTITNYGYIGGDVYGSINVGVGSSGGNDIITNAGTIAGSIYGADGNDKIIIKQNSLLKGHADGGSGSDTVYFENARNISNSNYINFEKAYINGTYGLRIDSSNNTLEINGPVFITNAVLDVYLPRALYANGKTWKIINATGQITGDFASITKNFISETINFTNEKTANDYKLIINRTSYSEFTDNKNTKALGRALDNLIPFAEGSLEDILLAMDFDLNAKGIATVLDGLTPDVYAVLPELVFNTSDIFNQKIYQHQLDLREVRKESTSDTTQPNWLVSCQLLQNTLKSDATNNVYEYKFKSDGFILGLDSDLGDIAQVGLFFGYTDGELFYQKNNSKGDIQTNNIGIYGSRDFSKFYLDTAITYSTAETNAQRLIYTPFASQEGNVSFDSDIFNFALSIGKNLKLKEIAVSPLASINYTNLQQNNFNEKSTSDFAITSKDNQNERFLTSLGFKFTHTTNKTKWFLKTRGKICWQHFFNDSPSTNVYLSRYPFQSFSLEANDINKDQILLNIGFNLNYLSTVSFYADYFINGTDKKNSQTFSGGIVVKF